jgi:hypothetical protein
MTVIDGARGRTKVYGWIDPSLNFSTSGHTNQPQGYDRIPNRIELQQSFVFVERLADTVQTKHFDVGYYFTFLYGSLWHRLRLHRGEGLFQQATGQI